MGLLVGGGRLRSDFLSACHSLPSIQLPLNVLELGDNVLSYYTSLTELDMSLWVGVKKLPDHFMSGGFEDAFEWCIQLLHISDLREALVEWLHLLRRD